MLCFQRQFNVNYEFLQNIVATFLCLHLIGLSLFLSFCQLLLAFLRFYAVGEQCWLNLPSPACSVHLNVCRCFLWGLDVTAQTENRFYESVIKYSDSGRKEAVSVCWLLSHDLHLCFKQFLQKEIRQRRLSETVASAT